MNGSNTNRFEIIWITTVFQSNIIFSKAYYRNSNNKEYGLYVEEQPVFFTESANMPASFRYFGATYPAKISFFIDTCDESAHKSFLFRYIITIGSACFCNSNDKERGNHTIAPLFYIMQYQLTDKDHCKSSIF